MNINIQRFYGTGRRKTSSARVWLLEGNGRVTVNKKEMTDKDTHRMLLNDIIHIFGLLEIKNKFNVVATVKGGGVSGQAGAIINGLVKAILNCNVNYKPVLKKHNLTTRDSRIVERKKYGQAGARKKFQYSKR